MIWTIQLRFKAKNGLAFFKEGDGPPLVLIHGVGLRAESWNAVIPALAKDYTLYALDLPGHGESQGFNGDDIGLKDYTDQIAAFLKALGQPAYVAGHSMGAMIALDLALRYPALVSKLVTLNAIYKRTVIAAKTVRARADDLAKSSDSIKTDVTLKRWFGTAPSGASFEAAQACETWLKATRLKEYAMAYRIFAYQDGPSNAALKTLTLPVLFMTGENEPNSTPQMSRRMAELAPSGQAQIIKGGAHMMIMTHGQDIAQSCHAFFKRTEG